ncbi:phage tail protein [Clostridium coskatii]|uniref:Tail spike domain-containing protein n=1 Tax=Clostridium coskatii TaxID=1705578 RepID=A0A166TTQ2_9CLOT|nr:phage tail protein [Clostridium coskatii]OAA94079.1 hypothetical protein WX73_03649 [Clostridium coskatii]OBR96641.1 hypothetical protein CLCOS_08030 [Clostridium coskatii]
MYKISIINGSDEIVVHYPDPEAPKVSDPHLNLKRSQAGSLTFSIPWDNPGYNLVTRFVTKVRCIDVRDDGEIFSGRVFSIKPSMTESGEFKKDIVCEGKMNYLQDTIVQSLIYEDKTPKDVIVDFLNYHNTQVEDYKKVQPGIIDVEDWLFFTTDFETTLEAIEKYVYDENKGFLKFRTEDGTNYLDYMANPPQDKIAEVSIGQNLKSLTIDDSQVFGTRIIPVGSNGLTIERVNDNKSYIEDPVAVKKYGIIYKKADYSDIDDDEELKTECTADLSQYTQPAGSLDISALDLSTLANTSVDSIDTATSVHIRCPILGVDDTYKVLELDDDLTKPWNPKLTISNKASKLSGTIGDIQSNSINRMATYGGVQLGYKYGLRVVSHDNSVEILINGKEGIVIKNDSKEVFYLDADGNVNMIDGYIKLHRGNIQISIDPKVGIEIKNDSKQVFYIDTSGNLIMDGIQKITKGGKVLIENTFNEYGGIKNVYDIDGNLVLKIGVEAGSSDNVGATLIGYNKGFDKPRFKLGIAKNGDFGVLELLNKDGQVKAEINADDGKGNGVVFIVNSNGVKQRLATELYVQEHMTTTGGGA